MNEKKKTKDKKIQDVLSQDGSVIASWITDMSTKAKTIGRQVVFCCNSNLLDISLHKREIYAPTIDKVGIIVSFGVCFFRFIILYSKYCVL